MPPYLFQVRWLIVIVAFVGGCSAPAEVDTDTTHENDADVVDSYNRTYGATDAGPAPPCVPKVVTFVDDDGGVHSVTFPCLSNESSSRGTSDPAGWGNDGYEPNTPPGSGFTLPPRTPPGDPTPF